MRCLLITNPNSGSSDQTLDAPLAILERGGFAVAHKMPKSPEALSRLVRDRGADADVIVIGGGDGTLSAAAAGLLKAGKPLGIFPMGTANDLARTLSLPTDLEEAAKVIVKGHKRAVDLGLVNDRPFFNVASIGFSAAVARHHRGERKRWLKLLSYPLSWIDAYRSHRSFKAEFEVDGVKHKVRCLQLAVGNGKHYGGGLTVAQDSDIDDGVLSLFYIKGSDFWSLFQLLPALKLGTLEDQDGATLYRGRSISLHTRKPQRLNVDGELLDWTPADFSIRQKALQIYCPDPSATTVTADFSAGLEKLSILRSDPMVSMNDAINALEKSVNLYRASAEAIANEDMTRAFEVLAKRREEMVEGLRCSVQKRDDIPNAVASERLLAEALVLRFKALVAEDNMQAALETIIAQEENLVSVLTDLQSTTADQGIAQEAGQLEAEIRGDLEILQTT